MQVTETSTDGLKREFRVVVPADEVEGEISRRLGELGQAIRVPGFRPGKVPMPLLRKRYGPAVRGEVLQSSVQSTSAEAMQQRNLRPALPPQVEIVSAAEGSDLEYKMSVELLPDLPALEFADLGLERLVADIPAEDVDKALDRMAEQQRKSEPVERAAETGDINVADLVGRTGDTEIPGTRGEGRQLEIGGAGLLPGFSEQLAGAKAGDERKVAVTFPADYANPDLAGKEAVFDVAVKEVRHRLPAVVDDELAKEVGLENLAELRQEIQERMQRDYESVTRQRLKRDLLDKLAARYDFAVPPGMVEIEFNNIMQQYEAEKAMREGAAAEPAAADAPAAAPEPKAEPAAADADEEKTKAEFRRIAERRVRLGLLLAEVGRSNNITVSQEEINQALTREARRHPGYERQVIDYYRKNPDAAGNLRAPIFEDKVVDFVVEMAKTRERKVSPVELMRFPEPDAAESEREEKAKKPAARRPRRKKADEGQGGT
jgi:trigger factor